MATCKWCGRSGWILPISANGMCDTCKATEVPLIVRLVQTLPEAQGVVDSTKAIRTRVERCDDLMVTPESTVTEATEALLVIDEARRDYGVGHPILDESEHLARRFIQETQLDGYLREAEKEAFVGNGQKALGHCQEALDHCQEALFFLSSEGMDGELRTEYEEKIERKTRELRGGT